LGIAEDRGAAHRRRLAFGVQRHFISCRLLRVQTCSEKEWDEKMSVGVKAMDDDHKALVGLLNEMSEALDSEQERKVLGAVLERMIQYTKDHLAREERLLAEHGYPDCTEHHKGHDLMIATALQAQASFRVGRSEMLSDGNAPVSQELAGESHHGYRQGIRTVSEFQGHLLITGLPIDSGCAATASRDSGQRERRRAS
jgi:hemerythrin